MKLVIPAYVERRSSDDGLRYWATPVFWEGAGDDDAGPLSAEDVLEERAVHLLEKTLTNHVREGAAELDHQELVRLSFSPVCQTHRLALRLELRRRTVQGDFLAVAFEGAGMRLIVLPKVRGLCFAWKAGADLRETAARVLQAHLRRLEKEAGDELPDFMDFVSAKEAHLTMLTISVDVNQRWKVEKSRYLALGDDTPPDGGEELVRTGRPFEKDNETPPVLLREGVTAELAGRLSAGSAAHPMIVVVGPAGSGKTAVLREALDQWQKQRPAHLPGRAWLVSPQRVISGMMYLGQWEARWLAILTHLAKRKDLLVLDDLTGLFHAGRSSGSDLSLGHVLKAQQERDAVTVVAEATPGAWARLREMDRSFADLFHVIHLREPEEAATLRILIRTMQSLESDHAVRFAPGVLPLIIALQRRYARTRAFPGKAVDMLRALGRAAAGQQVDCGFTLEWFCARSGFSLRFLNHSEPLERASVTGFLTQRIAGQEAAVRAMADTVMLARAQLNDPDRPLGTLLFTGPTGVGKTECAKALAEFVFGSAERMLRFDMNEFNGSDAADRLIGGFGRPGQLTGAVRRQPCGVLLLDEIEKAHPDVFDLLLQVLGEGRLTDAEGQTADFCNCIIILTSNLGAAARRQATGFQAVVMDERQVYREAAQQFFRPEFFNRLDRIVPFSPLSRGDIARLAGVLAQRALERPGLKARQLQVTVDGRAIDWLAARGFDSRYGARALRRAVEEHLVEPLAAYLAAADPGQTGTPAEMLVGIGTDGTLEIQVAILTQAAPWIRVPVGMSHPEALLVLGSVRQRLLAVEVRLEAEDFREASGKDAGAPPDAMSGGVLSDLDAWYYVLRDEISIIRARTRQLQDEWELDEEWRRRRSSSRASKAPAVPVDPLWRVLPPELLDGLLNRLRHAGPTARALTAVFESALPVSAVAAEVTRLVWRLGRLEALASPDFARPGKVALQLSDPMDDHSRAALSGSAGMDAWPFLGVTPGEGENEYILHGHGMERWQHFLSGIDAWADGGGAGISTRWVRAGNPLPAADFPREVLRLHTPQGLIDFRTGLVLVGGTDTAGDLMWALTSCHGPATVIS